MNAGAAARRRPAKPIIAVPAAEPRHHLDLTELADGWAFVIGWCAYSPQTEPDFALAIDGARHAPLVTISRQDVVDYLVHTATPGVDRFDLARSFAFAVHATQLDSLRLNLPGGSAPVGVRRLPEGTGPGVLLRYIDALTDAPASPAVDAMTAFLNRQLTELLAPGAADVASPPLAALRAASEPFGRLFGRRAPALRRRVALFAIHQTGRFLSASQTAMIRAFAAERVDVVLINSAPDAQAGLAESKAGAVAGLIRRGDHGRDLTSWLIALDLLGDRARSVEHLVLCNDSFFGPFAPLDRLMAEATRPDWDVWSLTDSWERGYHLQSSFMVLSARALASRAVTRFRSQYDFPNHKDAVVVKGEIGLSRALVEDGEMRLGVLAPYHELARLYLERADGTLAAARAAPGHWAAGEPSETLTWIGQLIDDLRSGMPRNPQHVFWDQLLTDHRIPFVKRELVQFNPNEVPDLFRIAGRVAHLHGTESAAEMTRDMRQASRRAPVW